MSPDWNGFSFVAGIGMPSTSLDSDGVEALSVSATYSNGPWFATLAYEDVSGEYVNDLLGGGVGNSHDFDKWRLGLGYTANGWHVGFIYEDREIDSIDTIAGFAGVSDDSDSWQLSTSYTAGNNTFKIAYGEVSEWGMNGTDAPYVVDDAEQWSVGIDHKLSNRTKLYAVYSDYSDGVADRDWDAVSVGIVHDF
jgi:predicted porin